MPEPLVAKAAAFLDGDRQIVTPGTGQEIGVFHQNGAYYAYSNNCIHSGGPACEGLLINKVVDIIAADRTYQGQTFSGELHFVCPWHGYEYDIKTSECVGDRRLVLKKFPVVKRDGAVLVIRVHAVQHGPYDQLGDQRPAGTSPQAEGHMDRKRPDLGLLPHAAP